MDICDTIPSFLVFSFLLFVDVLEAGRTKSEANGKVFMMEDINGVEDGEE